MTLAGVHVSGTELLWVETADLDLHLLDHVTVLLPTGEVCGQVYVTPDQVLQPPVQVQGRVVARGAPPEEGEDEPLSTSVPPLGTSVDGGIVIQVDPVNAAITLRLPDGEENTRTL